jgi:ATP-dependent Clp protease ATP-binding subunit ClpX
MIPEFIGRFPIISTVNSLTKDDLVRILTEPKNSLVNQYRLMMSLDGIDLTVSKDALELVAEIALKIGTGARGLRSMMESVLNDFVYEYSDSNHSSCSDEDGEIKLAPLEITKDDVEKTISKRYANYLED